MYLGCWSHPGPGHHTVTSVQWHMDAMMIFEHLPQICLILFANWRGEDSLIAEMTSRQTETRENESEPSAENSVSDSKNLVESSGCPSPGPPGQDKGTIWWCCHSINNGRKGSRNITDEGKTKYIPHISSQENTGKASIFFANSGCWLKVTNVRAFGGVTVESML